MESRRYIPYMTISLIVINVLIFQTEIPRNTMINITGDGDVSCYPDLLNLTRGIKDMDLPIHLGYTSGKGIDDASIVDKLINNGVIETTYTTFSTDPKIRKEWMNDPTPEASIEALKRFCESCDVHAASIIIPGVNDGEELARTCENLESWGAKALILMRFANTFNEGLILGNEPIIKGIESQPVEEFGELVKQINSEYKFRVSGTPVCDPETGGPFAIAKDENEVFLQFIKPITGEATVITSKIAEPYLTKIFSKLETGENVNIVACEKEIACLITKEDLEKLDLSEIKDTVIIPGRSFVHQLDAERILSADGVERLIGRGPDTLSVDGELSIDMTDENVIERELEEFNDLVDAINFFGMRRI